MKKPLKKLSIAKRNTESKKQDEPFMDFHEFMRRIIRVKPHEIKAKKA